MKPKKSHNLGLLGSIFVAMLLLLILHIAGFGIVYQEIRSMPKGFYLQLPVAIIHRDEIVIFQPTQRVENYIVNHGWIVTNMKMMKHVLGLPGDKVCNKHQQLFINQHAIGEIYSSYAPHHLLPQWHFCGHLPAHQYLVMSTFSPRSFDSRYFGPVSRGQIQYQGIKL